MFIKLSERYFRKKNAISVIEFSLMSLLREDEKNNLSV